VIVLVGYTRFPIFFNSNGRKIIGYKSHDEEFNEYVYSIKEKCIIIRSLSNIQYKSRFVVERKAINPVLKYKEPVPNYIYVYPDREPEEIITDAYTLGIVLKGARKPVYTPLLCLRMLTQKEVNALLNITEIKEFTLNKIEIFMQQLGLNIEKLGELAGNRCVLKIDDPEVDKPYRVLIDSKGRVLDVNFCIEMHQSLYLPELIMLVREQGSIYITSGFDYM